MKLKYNQNEYEVELQKKAEGDAVSIDNEANSFSYLSGGDNMFSIRLDGITRNIYITDFDKGFYLFSDGIAYTVEKVNDREDKDYAISAKSLDREEVKPPMPGSIVKIEVTVGQKVSEGDPLIIVEAMKMETTLYSSIDGVVTEINASPGEQVGSDKVLVVVEKVKE